MNVINNTNTFRFYLYIVLYILFVFLFLDLWDCFAHWGLTLKDKSSNSDSDTLINNDNKNRPSRQFEVNIYRCCRLIIITNNG